MKEYSQIKAVIAGRPQFTSNYEKALHSLGIEAYTSLTLGIIKNYDVLILPGGGDINPSLFREKDKGSRDIDTELDIWQIHALDFFVKHRKPVMGICKGMQLINIYFGGTLIQHLETADIHAYNNGDRIHMSRTLPHSVLNNLYGDYCLINSAHHQGIDKTGKGLRVTQIAADDVIEGIEHTAMPIIGVQWHPERLMDTDTKRATVDGSLIFHEFLSWIR